MPKAIFDVVTEYPEEQHVAEEVPPAGVQEHRRECGEHGEPRRYNAVRVYELLERAARQRLFKKERETVEDDEDDGEKWKGPRRNDVAQRNHAVDCVI